MPSLYLATERAAANLRRYVEAGGTLVVCCFSGIVDEHDRVYPGPYPGALRDVLGLTVEEWLPLRAGERVTLTWQEPGGAAGLAGTSQAVGTADVWTEAVILAGAKPVAWYADGPAAGGPASPGTTWALAGPGTSPPAPTPPTTAALLAAACESAGAWHRPATAARRPRRTTAAPGGPGHRGRPRPAAGRTAWSWCAAPTGSAASSRSSTTAPAPRPPAGGRTVTVARGRRPGASPSDPHAPAGTAAAPSQRTGDSGRSHGDEPVGSQGRCPANNSGTSCL